MKKKQSLVDQILDNYANGIDTRKRQVMVAIQENHLETLNKIALTIETVGGKKPARNDLINGAIEEFIENATKYFKERGIEIQGGAK